MKQARCHGEQPISFGASKALKYCEIQLKYLSSGIEKVIFAVFAFILGKPTKQLPPNRSCSLVLTFRSCTRSSISSAEKLLQSKRQGADAQLCPRSIFMRCNDVAMLRKWYTVAIYCTVRIEGVWSFSISSHMWDIMMMRADIGVFR